MHETRQHIIEFLKEKGQATVDELAHVVDLTPMAVRYHLKVLQADSLIEASTIRHQDGPGRPQQVYKLTDAADEFFPEDYHGLTTYLLDELSLRLGPQGVDEVFHGLANRLASEAPPPRPNQTFEERLTEVIEFLSTKGFTVCWEADGDDYLIHAYSCPYRQVVKDHQGVCQLDKHVIGSMLNAFPTRIACLTTGDHHCTYRISKSIDLIVDLA
jgi:predicted ArsR family transcriptional regulator